MDIEDLKPNSHAYKENQGTKDEKKIEKVVEGTAKVKKNEVRKFADVFISEDIKNVKSYVLMDILVPAIKNAIIDVVTDGVNMIFKGDTGKSSKSRSSTYVSYRDYSRRDDRRMAGSERERSRFDYDDIVFESRLEAERVREKMEDVIDQFGVVSVNDLFDMADLTAPYTSHKYGWTSIRNAEIVRTREGYVIKLPRAVPIDY